MQAKKQQFIAKSNNSGNLIGWRSLHEQRPQPPSITSEHRLAAVCGERSASKRKSTVNVEVSLTLLVNYEFAQCIGTLSLKKSGNVNEALGPDTLLSTITPGHSDMTGFTFLQIVKCEHKLYFAYDFYIQL